MSLKETNTTLTKEPMPNLVSSRRLPPQPPALALGALDLAGTRALHVRAAPGRGDAEAARAAGAAATIRGRDSINWELAPRPDPVPPPNNHAGSMWMAGSGLAWALSAANGRQ